VGGFVAAALSRAGENVVVVAREETAAAISQRGIAVDSVGLGRFTAHPAAGPELRESSDFLIVATKATTLPGALDRIRSRPRLVVPLLNGLDHMAILHERFGGDHVAAGAIRIEAVRPAPGRILQTSPMFRVELAADHAELHPLLADLAQRLESAGIPAEIGPSEAQVLWSKLVRLCPLALTTAVSGRPIGSIRSDPQWRRVLEAAIAEAAAVASVAGAGVDPGQPLAELDSAHPTLSSSMRRDLAAGRPPELAIPRSVLRAASAHGLRCPTIEELTEAVARRAGL
jgi:2-dehydropantoate 2-reductase